MQLESDEPEGKPPTVVGTSNKDDQESGSLLEQSSETVANGKSKAEEGGPKTDTGDFDLSHTPVRLKKWNVSSAFCFLFV